MVPRKEILNIGLKYI